MASYIRGMTMMEALLIPEDRVGVLTKDVIKMLEEKTGTKIGISGNAVTIDGDGLQVLAAKNFVRAVGRGFSPERASRLLEEDQILEEIDLGRLSEAMQRNCRARIIGTGGKMREKIELSTGASISVYGKTVSIIGGWNEVKNARRAIEMLIKGAEMSTVNRWLKGVE